MNYPLNYLKQAVYVHALTAAMTSQCSGLKQYQRLCAARLNLAAFERAYQATRRM